MFWSQPWEFCPWSHWRSHCSPFDCSKLPLKARITFRLWEVFQDEQEDTILYLYGQPVCEGIYPSLPTTPGIITTSWQICKFLQNLLRTLRVLSSLPDTILLPENCKQVITWSSCPFNTCKTSVKKCFVLVFVYNYIHFQRIQSSPLDSWWGWPSNSSQYCAASWNRTSTASKQTLSWSCLAFCCPWIWSTMNELYCGRFNLIERENSPAVPESSLPAFLSPEQIVLCQHPPVPELILLICRRWSPLTAKDSWGQ